MKKMKYKTLSALAAAMMVLALMPVQTLAEEEEAPAAENAENSEEDPGTFVDLEAANYRYKIDDAGNVSLYDFHLSDEFQGELVIPSEIEGHPVTYLGNACFAESKGVTSVVIPASVTDMGDNVFFACTALQYFIVEDGNPYYSTTEDGVLMGDSAHFLVAYPAGRPDVTYTIPDKVDELAPGAFGFSENLREIIVPDGVHFIDNWCFAYSGIERAEISGSVTQLDDYAFAYCRSLKEVDLKYGIENIYNATFAYCSALEQITIPASVTRIGQYAFCGTGLSCVTIPSSVEDISYCAFGYDENMNAIKSFTIYGEPYSTAASYANSSDDESDYSNSFNFIAVVDASIPYELGGGMLVSDLTEPVEEVVTEINEDGEIIIVETEPEEGIPAPVEEEIGANLFGSKRLQLMLAIGGGAALILALVLIVAFVKKPKQKKKPAVDLEKKPEETPAEETAPEEEAPAEEEPSAEEDPEEDPEA